MKVGTMEENELLKNLVESLASHALREKRAKEVAEESGISELQARALELESKYPHLMAALNAFTEQNDEGFLKTLQGLSVLILMPESVREYFLDLLTSRVKASCSMLRELGAQQHVEDTARLALKKGAL